MYVYAIQRYKQIKEVMKIRYSCIFVLGVLLALGSCTVSYKFNGASIDYSKVKTITIGDFPNMAESVYAPLSSMFSEELRDVFSRQTRLEQVRSGGDMDIQGEIVGYTLTPLSVGSDGLATETRITLTVNVRYTNNKDPEDDFEKQYSAYQTFNSDQLLVNVQDQLVPLMIDDITNQIFNDTAAKW